MALRALQIRVALRQVESRCTVIREGAVVPGGRQRAVALGAVLEREPVGVGLMSGVRGLLPRVQVTARIPAIAIRDARQIVVVSDMARGARSACVRVVQQEARRRVTEAVCVCPGVERKVARGARGRREYRIRFVIRVGRRVEFRRVAGFAGRGKAKVIPLRCVLVALIALHNRMHAEQREAVEVLRNLLNGNLPAGDGVALRAIRSELPSVEVRMAIGAILADVGENRFDVAARARNLLMQAAQRILGRIVIEFGDRADGRPACCRVAVLAGNIERAVGTLLWLALSRKGRHSGGNHQPNTEPPGDLRDSANNCPHKEKNWLRPSFTRGAENVIPFDETYSTVLRARIGTCTSTNTNQYRSHPNAAGGLPRQADNLDDPLGNSVIHHKYLLLIGSSVQS